MILSLLSFAGHVALLLWGVHMVQTGMQRACGAALGETLNRALATRLRGFAAGLAITAALQSSTATGLMIAGLAAGGAVTLVPALAAMLGANVGTTLIVQVLSFDLTALAPILILVGVWLFRRSPPGAKRDSGRIFIGLGLLLTALHQLVGMFAALQATPLLVLVLDSLTAQPMAAVLLAAVLTWLAHSSVAVVVLIMSLTAHDVASPMLAYALVLGANLGTAINPLLEGVGSNNDPAARRLPLGNLLTRVAGVLAGLIAMPWVAPWVNHWSLDAAHAVANVHTLFNLAVALAFLPVLTPYASLLARWLPKQADPNDPGQPLYLDDSAHDVPAVALGNAAREALRMADMLQTLLQYARAGLRRERQQRTVQARQLDGALDKLEVALIAYLARLDHDTTTPQDRQRATDILTFAAQIGRAADAAHQLISQINRMRKQGWAFRPEQIDELDATFARLIRNQRQSAALFVSEDLSVARLLAAEKTWFREQEHAAASAHIQSIKHGDANARAHATETSALYLEVRRIMQSLNSRLIEASAYPQLARHGELLTSRVRGEVD